MISVTDLSKSFGHQLLFDEASFKLNPKERIGLVGRNGFGKTTLFRLVIGEEAPDSGTLSIPKNYRIGYVRQQIDFTKNTVLEEGMTGLREEARDHSWKAEKILSGLGFSKADMLRHPSEFSGGFQVRLNLAKVLVSEPDLLLLDEPTNYLDITSIRWVERFLSKWPREFILITHDRGLMDRLVTHTMGIHRKKFRKIVGNTEKYYAQIAQDEEIYEKTRVKDERRRKEIEQFISRFRAKARLANLVQSRIKTLDKQGKKEKLEKLKTLDFSFRSSPFQGRNVMRAENVSFSYGPRQPLIRNFNVAINSRDRICIIGKNGKGKTTLIKLLAQELEPQHGKIICNSLISKGFFEQDNVQTLVDSRTVEEEILYSHPDVDRQKARNICGAMMFEGDAALKKINVLSGGEKNRVMLGKILATPVNLLLLDEPTNHLDMESCDALLAAIDNFDGTVIMVTHNELFLDAIAERLIVFQNDQITVFEGSYQWFLESSGWKDETKIPEPAVKEDSGKASRFKPSKKTLRRKRSEFVSERAKVLNPMKQHIARIEKEIGKNEQRLNELNSGMQAASQDGDGVRIAELSQSIHQCRSAIDMLFDELEGATAAFEKQRAFFAQKFQQLDSDMI